MSSETEPKTGSRGGDSRWHRRRVTARFLAPAALLGGANSPEYTSWAAAKNLRMRHRTVIAMMDEGSLPFIHQYFPMSMVKDDGEPINPLSMSGSFRDSRRIRHADLVRIQQQQPPDMRNPITVLPTPTLFGEFDFRDLDGSYEFIYRMMTGKHEWIKARSACLMLGIGLAEFRRTIIPAMVYDEEMEVPEGCQPQSSGDIPMSSLKHMSIRTSVVLDILDTHVPGVIERAVYRFRGMPIRRPKVRYSDRWRIRSSANREKADALFPFDRYREADPNVPDHDLPGYQPWMRRTPIPERAGLDGEIFHRSTHVGTRQGLFWRSESKMS